MDLPSLLDKMIPTLLTSAGGAAGAVWRFYKALSTRLAAVESGIETLKLAMASAQVDLSNQKVSLSSELELLRQVLSTIRKDMDAETEEIYGNLRTRAREQSDLRRIFTKLTERYIGLEARLEQTETAVNNMNDSLKSFMKEQHDQWQTTAKALGQIDGYLQGISRRTSGNFPPVK